MIMVTLVCGRVISERALRLLLITLRTIAHIVFRYHESRWWTLSLYVFAIPRTVFSKR